ncbi:arylsulfatase B-like isoform X4 [Haliotis rubra]|uniref:arylsulfatase B-like isoform X4 n=1 Tax=Haliotis rubra TaxID=36100 RepID=UPI001EE6182C|nr:arylsulfatase B-like isoform X4 [Haliotis rubra]
MERLVASLVVVCTLWVVPATSSVQPPHIVFIVADDLGWNDVGFHNPQMITPNIDSLARQGVILNSSYVQPVCSPSRNCFMTGYYPYHTGLQHDVIFPLIPGYVPANFTMLPQKLKELGYATHAVGKWHLGFCNWKYTPTMRGFDSFLGYYNGAEDYYTRVRDDGFDFRFNKTVARNYSGPYSAMTFASRAEEIIRTHDKTKPLYLYLPFQSVHEPLQVPQRFEDMYRNITTKQRRTYCGMVSALDEAIGNITQALRDSGLIDNLLLVFTTDNGGPTYAGANNLPLRGAKTTLWEGGTKGTAFVYSKTLLKKLKYTNTGMIHAVDWFPTLLHLAGGRPDPGLDGVNQWDMLSKNWPSNRLEFVYNIDDLRNNSAIRYGDMKLIYGKPGDFNDWYPLPRLDEIFQMDKKTWPQYQLYNLTADPTERHNLATKFPDLLASMKQRLEGWRQSMVPAHYPPRDPKGDPKNWGGVWSPGWC